MFVASIDIGLRNFAICVQWFPDYLLKNLGNDCLYLGEIVFWELKDVAKEIKVGPKDPLDTILFKRLNQYLDSLRDKLQGVMYLLVEIQKNNNKTLNYKAARVFQHICTYFYLKYPTITVIEYPSSHKSQLLGAPKGLKTPQLKKWCIDKAASVLINREDHDSHAFLMSHKKKDDLADTFCMIESYKVLLAS